jgi:hypothetical protein
MKTCSKGLVDYMWATLNSKSNSKVRKQWQKTIDLEFGSKIGLNFNFKNTMVKLLLMPKVNQ